MSTLAKYGGTKVDSPPQTSTPKLKLFNHS